MQKKKIASNFISRPNVELSWGERRFRCILRGW